MEIVGWLQFATICLLGAMSPGPSLALVLRNSVSRGKIQGALTGFGHGVGVGLYAIIIALGLSIIAKSYLFNFVQVLGSIFLLWYGSILLFKKSKFDETEENKILSGAVSFNEGFLIAFLNPKIFVFFLAVFTQFITSTTSQGEKVLMAAISGTVDTIWYISVAVLLSVTGLIFVLKKYKYIIDKAMGLLLIILALGFIIQLVHSINVV
jgi:threonine/homoserine/homoserine lactone efflux protein